MASTVALNQALQGRHLSASHGLADDLGVAARSSDNQNGWAGTRGLNNAFASVVSNLDKMSDATGSIQSAVGLDGDGDLSWGATSYINDSNNMKQGILSLDSYINNGFVTRIGLVSGSNGSFAANNFAQPANAKFAATATFQGAIEALHADHIDVSSSVANILDSADLSLDQFHEVVTAYTAMSASLDLDLADLQSVIGVGDDANLGTFTGDTIADSQSIKQALQALETAVEGNDTDIAALQTLSGVADEAEDLGTFDGGTVGDNLTVKAAIQALETAVEGNDTDIAANDTDIAALQTLSGVADEAEDLGVFASTGPITDNVDIKTALGELDDHASNTRSDFRAVLADGDVAGAVGAEYYIGFAAGAPQIRLVERAGDKVDVYFEIR